MNKLNERDVENLIELVEELQLSLKKKREQLTQTRQKLANAKQTIQRLQVTVNFQRERILDFHRGNTVNHPIHP